MSDRSEVPSGTSDVAPIAGVLQHYSWGSLTAIAELSDRPPSGEPEAELWFGAHERAPAGAAVAGETIALNDLIAGDPISALGSEVSSRFDGQLPFLLKILAAGQPLSIQAHPSIDQAQAGYAREDALGVAVDAPNRSFRDSNHKPELICALTPFKALCGFRSPEPVSYTHLTLPTICSV